MATCHNKYQQFDKHKRVVCVCAAGLLRSPTAAVLLAGAPWYRNTRAVGIVPEFALVMLDEVMMEWGEEFVCMTQDQADTVRGMLHDFGHNKPVFSLNIPDDFNYRDPQLVEVILSRYSYLVSLNAPNDLPN